MKFKLTAVRAAFLKVFTAEAVNGEGTPMYSLNALLNPAHPDLTGFNAVIEQVATEKWGSKAAAILQTARLSDKVCLHSGDTKAGYAGFAGNLYVAARSATPPLVIDANKTPLTAKDGKLYSGCYVNVSIDVWAQDNKYGKRINASLCGVQFVKDGEAFSGSGAASVDEFDDLTEGAAINDLL